MADENRFELNIYSPTRIFFEGEADMIELVTTEGEIGVYKNHIPLTAVIAPGILRIHDNGQIKEATLLEGFLEILPDKVTVLSESCEWPEEIDRNRAEEAKIRAERRLSSPTDVNYNRAELALRRSLIRLQLADKYR